MATRTRVVGSGHTSLFFNNKRLALLDGFVDRGQSPNTPPFPVISLDDSHPSEIVVSNVVGAGTLMITIREAWEAPIWQQLLSLVTADTRAINGVNSLPDLQIAMASAIGDGELLVQMVITNPTGKTAPRGKTYHNCVITEMSDEESVTVSDLTVAKSITLMYTHCTYFTGSRP